MSTAKTDAKMLYFELLTENERREAIARLARSGMSDYGISSATGLAVEQIRRILGERANA
jgi:hypothetical protein